MFIAVRFLLGAGEGVIYPAANQFVARWIPVRERGIANGWIFAGVGAGADFRRRSSLIDDSLWMALVVLGVRHHRICSPGQCGMFAARDTPADHPRVSAAELGRDSVRA